MAFLTDEQRAVLKVQHKHERDKRICDRIKAVILYDKGWSVPAIAEALLLSDDAIRRHIDDYRLFLKLKPASGGSTEKLSEEQSDQLENHLQKHTYLYVKDIVIYVQATWNISYTIHGLRNWLQRHGFSYKKPALVPGKANKQEQIKWLADYHKLKQELPEDETICFMDGVHPTHNVQAAYGWIKKGVRKEIPANTGRSRINLSGALDMLSYKIVIQQDPMLNAKATILFFQKIEAAYPDKKAIHVFVDNARYYRNKLVREYLKTSKIKLHFLPPYSPNLNPIERLWKWMKERVLYNSYYPEFEEFKSAIFGFFSTLQNIDLESELGQCLRSRVRDHFRPIDSPLTSAF
jgi:transposase